MNAAARERKRRRRYVRRNGVDVALTCPSGCGGQISQAYPVSLFPDSPHAGIEGAMYVHCTRCNATFLRAPSKGMVRLNWRGALWVGVTHPIVIMFALVMAALALVRAVL